MVPRFARLGASAGLPWRVLEVLLPVVAALLFVPLVSAAAPVERRLYPDRVDASSFLWNDWNRFQENYHPLYAVDDDPVTAWVEGVDGDGAGEWVRFDVTDLDGTSSVRLRVRNGYQKSASLWKANARARDVVVRLLPSGVEVTATLADKDGWQELSVAQPPGPLSGVELRVASAYAGSKYQDLCISDVEVYATSTTRDNPTAETAKLARVKAWKAERVEAAAIFKASTGGRMPLASAYSVRAVGPEREYQPVQTPFEGLEVMLGRLRSLAPDAGYPGVTREINLAVAAVQGRFAGWKPVQVTPTDARALPALDGLAPADLWSCYEGAPVWGDLSNGSAWGHVELPTAGKLGYLRADTLGAFEVAEVTPIEAAMNAGAPACSSPSRNGRPAAVYAWARTSTATPEHPARVEALLTVGCGSIEVREGTDRAANTQLLVYDAAGRLSVLAGPAFALQYAWRGDGDAAVIAGARRVAMYGPDIVLTEGQPVAKR